MNQVREQDIRSDNMNKDSEDLAYIKKFTKITVTEACKLAGVDQSNLWSGKTSKKNIKKVKRIIESCVAKLYLVEDLEDE